jgi:dihydrofolate reductase
MRPQTAAFVGVSLDGFLARLDGTLDWLSPWEGHDHGYSSFFSTIDTLIFGRKTWECVASMVAQGTPWPYDGKRCAVLTHRPAKTEHGELVWNQDLALLLADLHAQGSKRVYVDGGTVIRQFLAQGLLDSLTLSIVPCLIGTGLPLFGGVAVEKGLVLESVQSFPNGLAQLKYRRQ